MKRLGLVLAGLALAGAANTADAQLTMQMGNGWNFTFAGNVNAFMMYASQSDDGDFSGLPGALTGVGGKGFFFGTGLLPAFATFEAKGKEGDLDLGVHFGFAPEVQCGGGIHDCFGAQIDMRQVYLTVGGTWGQILMGKELALFNRQNILQDQTLFGIGATSIAPSGTTLGRIGFGYVYPNFVGQLTYSTAAGKPAQFSIGLFDPSALNLGCGITPGCYTETQIPRVEAELTFKSESGFLGWINGTVQNAKDPIADQSKTATGVGGGLKFGKEKFSLTGSGYWGKGIGTTLQFSGVGPALGGLGVDPLGNLRTSYGFYAQATVTAGKTTIAGSYGSSWLQATDEEVAPGGSIKTENSMISAGLYNQVTKSLKWVLEGDYQWSKGSGDGVPDGLDKNTQFTIGTGLMLFY